MAIDASIFGMANKPTIALANPMEQLNQLATAQNAVNQNKLFQGQAAVGRAFQQATAPDGTLDVNQARSLIANDPTAAPAAQAANESAQNLNVSQQGVALRNVAIQRQALAGLVGMNGGQGPTMADLQQQLQQGLQQGWLQPHNAQAVLTGMPSGDDPQSMATRKHMLTTLNVQLMSPAEQQAATLGTGEDQQRGDVTVSGVRAPISQGYGFTPTSSYQPGMSPAQQAGTTTIPLPGGAEQQLPTGDYARRAGINPTPNIPGSGGRAAPGNIPPMRMQPPAPPAGGAAPPPAPGQAAPAAQPPGFVPAPAGFVPSAPPQPQGASADIKQSPAEAQSRLAGAAAHTAAVQDSAGYNDRITALNNAASALGQAKTGSGSDILQGIASRLQTLSPSMIGNVLPSLVNRTPEQIEAYDAANKYLTRIQLAGPGAGRSDQGLATAGAATPSVNISPMAAKLLVTAQLGQERMHQAQLMQFDATHPIGQEDQYGRYLTATGPTLDPRGFIADKQTQAERAAVLNSLPAGSTARANYLNSYALGKKHGLVDALGN